MNGGTRKNATGSELTETPVRESESCVRFFGRAKLLLSRRWPFGFRRCAALVQPAGPIHFAVLIRESLVALPGSTWQRLPPSAGISC
jgi:hypothetical protein